MHAASARSLCSDQHRHQQLLLPPRIPPSPINSSPALIAVSSVPHRPGPQRKYSETEMALTEEMAMAAQTQVETDMALTAEAELLELTAEELRAAFEQQLKQCYHCGYVSGAESPFKYFDNQKLDQPWFQCCRCHKLFTLGSHSRPQGKTYHKKKNVDPEELRGLHRQCRHCGVTDNALFKYYNNNSKAQPRFKCLSCHKQFQMRLVSEGHERHLFHTGSTKPSRQKRGLAKTPSCNTLSTDGSPTNSRCDEMIVPQHDPCNTHGAMACEQVNEDVTDFMDLIEAGLREHTNDAHVPMHDAHTISQLNSCTNANVGNVHENTESAPPMDPTIMEDIFDCDQSGLPLCVESYHSKSLLDLRVWNDTMELFQSPNLEPASCNITSNVIPLPDVPLGECLEWASDDGLFNEYRAPELMYNID